MSLFFILFFELTILYRQGKLRGPSQKSFPIKIPGKCPAVFIRMTSSTSTLSTNKVARRFRAPIGTNELPDQRPQRNHEGVCTAIGA